MLQVFQLLIVPVAIGMLLRRWLPASQAEYLRRIASALSFGVMIFVVVVSIAGLRADLSFLVPIFKSMAVRLITLKTPLASLAISSESSLIKHTVGEARRLT